ncbi:transketolase C-terminal domain-containing protein [Bartonella sp. MM73XJBT.G]|uniref:transketolase C-terminal domain-containing protein n=1 Tax=Bartonella sp. MM73XJBT.G TaxID=3019097 RepID=UPI0031837DDB
MKNIHNNVLSNAAKIDISKDSVIKKGKDILLFANGRAVQICFDAIAEIKKYEIIPTVVSVTTIQSLDDCICIKTL